MAGVSSGRVAFAGARRLDGPGGEAESGREGCVLAPESRRQHHGSEKGESAGLQGGSSQGGSG